MTTIQAAIITSYLDGEIFGRDFIDATEHPVVENDFDLTIGGMIGWDANRWVGGIDDIRLWNVARTDQEIKNNFNTIVASTSTGLAVDFDFEAKLDGNYVDSVNGLVAKVHGNVAVESGAPISGGSNGISLDGSGYLQVHDAGASPLDLGTSFTIEAWYQFGFNQTTWDANQPWGGSQHATILSKNYSHPSTNMAYGVYRPSWNFTGADGRDSLGLTTWVYPYAEEGYAAAVRDTLVTGISSNSDWHHIAFTREAVLANTGTDISELLGGSAGVDYIYGLAGNDTISGSSGCDGLYGGSGDDVVDYSASTGGILVSLKDGTGFGGDADGDHPIFPK